MVLYMHILTIEDLKKTELSFPRDELTRIAFYFYQEDLLQQMKLFNFAKKHGYLIFFINKKEDECIINLSYQLKGLIDILLVNEIELSNIHNIRKKAKIPIVNIDTRPHTPFNLFSINSILNNNLKIIQNKKINYELYNKFNPNC